MLFVGQTVTAVRAIAMLVDRLGGLGGVGSVRDRNHSGKPCLTMVHEEIKS